MDIVKEVPWERRNNSPTVTDTGEYNLKMYLEELYEITSERVIKAGIDIISNENKYHPIREYLESLVWDGVPRIENMLPHFLGAEKSKYTIGVMKMHMLAAISRIYEPGIKYDIMLCLVGSQGAGKSTFFKYLAIKEEWFSDNLDHLDDENIYRKLQNHWIIEMGEMKATITAKNIEQIKSFLSRQKETYKVPYEVHPEDRPRQCVFCGTSNDLNFLPLDRTGNRRFAPVMTDMSKAEVHILDNEAESKRNTEEWSCKNMKKQIYDEKNGLSYTLHGDYYLPDLEINEEEPVYGKYGIMRKQFLKEHKSARYQYLVLTGKLTEHLNQVDKEVREKVEMLMEQMVEHWGVTEELKMKDQMEWVRRMNNIKNAAEKSALKIIYS